MRLFQRLFEIGKFVIRKQESSWSFASVATVNPQLAIEQSVR
jgi:hypothetical protein